MKKLLSTILALTLLLSVAASCATAETMTAFTCAEQQFSVSVPEGATAQYDDSAKGLMIYTKTPGSIPYIIVSRRPLDKKFSNPENYLNNVYREYLEEKHGDNFLGMIDEAGTWELDGKKLTGAEYKYKIGEYTVVHLQLIEVRDAGDVEYTVKFVEDDYDATITALTAAVRSYQETDAAPAAADPAPADTGDYAVPTFLTPSVFVGNYNAMIEALADKYADQLGEEGVRIVKEDYSIVQKDINGTYAWYGNNDWSIEAAYIFADEGSVSDSAPALQMNFNIKNEVPDAVKDFAVYALKMMIAYEYQEEVPLDDLSAWFSTADDPSNVYKLPGYDLCTYRTEEYTQYMILIPADRNPFAAEE